MTIILAPVFQRPKWGRAKHIVYKDFRVRVALTCRCPHHHNNPSPSGSALALPRCVDCHLLLLSRFSLAAGPIGYPSPIKALLPTDPHSKDPPGARHCHAHDEQPRPCRCASSKGRKQDPWTRRRRPRYGGSGRPVQCRGKRTKTRRSHAGDRCPHTLWWCQRCCSCCCCCSWWR